MVAVAAVVLLVALGLAAVTRGPDRRAAAAAACRLDRRLAGEQSRLDSHAAHPVVVVGDSYALGFGINSAAGSWPRLMGEPVVVLAQGGAGYTRNGSCDGGKYDGQVAAALRLHPRSVIVQGGLNDLGAPPKLLRTEALRVAAHLPAESVLVGPAAAPAASITRERAVDAILRSVAAARRLRYVSLLPVIPVRDFGPDGVHPTEAGERLIAAAVRTG